MIVYSTRLYWDMLRDLFSVHVCDISFHYVFQPASVTAMPACATPTAASVSAQPKASRETAATCEFHNMTLVLLFTPSPQAFSLSL